VFGPKKRGNFLQPWVGLDASIASSCRGSLPEPLCRMSMGEHAAFGENRVSAFAVSGKKVPP
jgi:hypothetical protein